MTATPPIDFDASRILREAVYRLYARSTMGHRRRSALLSVRMSRCDSGLGCDYCVSVGADLVLRVTELGSGNEVATAHLFDAVARLHHR